MMSFIHVFDIQLSELTQLTYEQYLNTFLNIVFCEALISN